METFASNDNKEYLYYDFPFYKKTNSNGSMVEYTNSDALAQAVKIWLVSKRNEKIRSLGGGILYPHLGKVMDDDRASLIRDSIINGLKKDFTPPLTVVSVDVIPNYEKEMWEIGIVAFNADLQIGVNTKTYVTNALV